MPSDFLNNLKKTVETGEFNSEAAKKIIEINTLVENKNYDRDAYVKALDAANKEEAIQTVTEQEAAALNSAYEKKMAEIKKQDAVNAQLATLVEIEDMVVASIDDMLSYVDELELKFAKEFESEDPMYGELYMKIEKIKSQYKNNN